MLKPRPYQAEAVDACNEALLSSKDNPLIVLPTGAGKSFVMALLIQKWKKQYPPFRCMVLAHRKELVEQNGLELLDTDPMADVGFFSASMNRRDTINSIIFAGIDSVAKKANQFPKMDVLLIDEAHRIPVKGEGKYREFIANMKARNPAMRVVGLTATPYRMGIGQICHKDHILNSICYEANVGDLINDGYLCPLKTVDGDINLDLKGVKKTAGEFNLKDLASQVDKADVVSSAIGNALIHIADQERQSIIVFCIDIEHCKHVQEELEKHGIKAASVTGKTPKAERERLVEDFKAGKMKWMISVNVFFEGFNVRRVDCILMLRPTQSKGLWVQAVGRGLRLSPEKDYCLVLDYGENIFRHGPIDMPDDDEPKAITCHNCKNVFSKAVKKCPCCGWEVPKRKPPESRKIGEGERKMHTKSTKGGLILNEPTWIDVEGVSVSLHRKMLKPDSVAIHYRLSNGLLAKHWLCIDHGGWAAESAKDWLIQYGFEANSTEEFLQKYTGIDVFNKTKALRVRFDKKYLKITGYEFKKKTDALRSSIAASC